MVFSRDTDTSDISKAWGKLVANRFWGLEHDMSIRYLWLYPVVSLSSRALGHSHAHVLTIT